MARFTDQFIDLAGSVLRKIPNIPGKNFYSKLLLKPFINKMNPERILRIQPGNSKLICRLKDWIPWNIYLHGRYIVEEIYERYLLRTSTMSKTVFDVGANIGYYTVQMAGQTTGKIYAFEPMNYQYETLRKNILLNNLDNVVPVKKIASDISGYQRIYFSGMENTAASSLVNETIDFEDVRSTPLDEFCCKNRINNVDVIKIDVEGYEMNVLRGLTKMLTAKKVTHLFVEMVDKHLKKAGTSARKICDFLKSHNYQGYSIKSGTLEPYQVGNDESLVYFTAERPPLQIGSY